MTDAKDHSLDTLFTFPARFPIKVMGNNATDFRATIDSIIAEKIPRADLIEVKEQMSRNKKYIALTIIATFHDKPAIDAVYQALSTHPLVLMAL